MSTETRTGTVIALDPERSPNIDTTAWLAPGAVVVGAVSLGPGSSVWYNAVLRGDSNSITVGRDSNFQDGVAVHTEAAHGAVVGDRVSVGHNAVVHAATIEDDCLIGMNATVLSGAVVGTGSLIAAGALVPQGRIIPPNSLVAGVPARVVRELTDAERESVQQNAEIYIGHTAAHRAAVERMRAAPGNSGASAA